MIQKMSSFKLKNLSWLSKKIVSFASPPIPKCYSTVCSNQTNKLPKLNSKSNVFPVSSKVANVSGNGLIQKRFMSKADHVQLWKIERLVSAIFLPLVPACFLLENSVLDATLAILTVAHTHWGLEAIIIDYARPSVVGNVLPKVLMTSLFVLSALTLAGLLVLVVNGPGISKAIKRGWAIGKEKNE